jgi:hypothetical protein
METQTLTIIDGYIGELGFAKSKWRRNNYCFKKMPKRQFYSCCKWSGFGNNPNGERIWKWKIAYTLYVGFQETSRSLPTLNARVCPYYWMKVTLIAETPFLSECGGPVKVQTGERERYTGNYRAAIKAA